jgi:hypothetical protein
MRILDQWKKIVAEEALNEALEKLPEPRNPAKRAKLVALLMAFAALVTAAANYLS